MAIAIRRCLSTAVPMNTAISHHSEFTTRLVLDHEPAGQRRTVDRGVHHARPRGKAEAVRLAQFREVQRRRSSAGWRARFAAL